MKPIFNDLFFVPNSFSGRIIEIGVEITHDHNIHIISTPHAHSLNMSSLSILQPGTYNIVLPQYTDQEFQQLRDACPNPTNDVTYCLVIGHDAHATGFGSAAIGTHAHAQDGQVVVAPDSSVEAGLRLLGSDF